jgi:hypothetical protein
VARAKKEEAAAEEAQQAKRLQALAELRVFLKQNDRCVAGGWRRG